MKSNLTVYFDSLGCVKNLVDSELALGLLDAAGFVMTDDPTAADVVVVNTCGFINDAKEESIERILTLAELKQERCRALVVCGCLSEKYRAELTAEMPEIDILLGTNQYDVLVPKLVEFFREAAPEVELACPTFDAEACLSNRHLLTPPATAYLKIAEGCNNNCTFCAIPGIRGRLMSRRIEDIITEAEALLARGVKELILIAQDTTAYGMDIYGKPSLAPLLNELAKLPFVWIRALYSYPDRIDDELLRTMAEHQNICHYLDIPLQHVSGAVLHRMGRTYDRDYVLQLFAKIKAFLPDVVIRTTFMVGFPGETEADFNELMEFVNQVELAWAGVFRYSQEDGTVAGEFDDQIDEAIKSRRYNRLVAALGLNAGEHKAKWLNREMDVLLEAPSADLPGYFEARSRFHAPDVDGIVYVDNQKNQLSEADIGKIIKIKVHTAETYDIIGCIVE